MNKYIKRISLLCFLCIVIFSSCVLDKYDKEKIEKDNVVNIDFIALNAPNNYSFDKNVIGASEYAIKKVRLYIYSVNGDTLRSMHYFNNITNAVDGKCSIKIPYEISDRKDLFFAIVNEPDILTPILDDTLKYRSINDIKTIGLSINDFLPQIAYTIEDESLLENFLIPFVGELPVSTESHYQKGPIGELIQLKIEVFVERIISRFDVIIRKNASVKDVIKVDGNTSLSIYNVKDSTLLIMSDSIPNYKYKNYVDISQGTGKEIEVPLFTNNNQGVHLFSFYLPNFYFPEQGKGKDKSFGFELKGVKFPNEVKDYFIEVGTNKNLVKTDRNTVYKIYCTLDDSDLSIKILLNKWGEESRIITL